MPLLILPRYAIHAFQLCHIDADADADSFTLPPQRRQPADAEIRLDERHD